MRTILLLRHAKSDWEADYEADHDRPLAKRGRKAAARMGRYLAALGELPDRVVCSSAVRARETVRLAAEAGSWEIPVEVAGELYAASVEEVFAVLRRQRDADGSLLLVGHEPTFSEVLAALVGGARVRFPTAALARVDVAAERWRDVAPDRGALQWLVTPRLLEEIGWKKRKRRP